MKAWGVTEAQVARAAESVGVRVSGLRSDTTGVLFTLRTSGPTTDGKPVKYGRHSQRVRRKDGKWARIPGAVCWHGHRDFMRQLFVASPEARLKSALADYRGRDDFEARHGSTYGHPAQYMGYNLEVGYGAACDCEEGSGARRVSA